MLIRFFRQLQKIIILGKHIIFCLWSERSVGKEGQGESVSALKFLWKDSVYMFWVCTSGVLNSTIWMLLWLKGTPDVSRRKKTLWEPLIANLSIWAPNPCLKTTKTTRQVKNKATKYPNDPWYDRSHRELSDYCPSWRITSFSLKSIV